LDEQAAERDAERDEFSREVEKLRISLKEKENKDKDKSALQNFEKKVKCLRYSSNSYVYLFLWHTQISLINVFRTNFHVSKFFRP